VLTLPWMRPDAPYMPVATMGLLAALPGARASWQDECLTIDEDRELDDVAAALLEAPLPDPDAIPWPRDAGQSLASVLAAFDDPIVGFARLCAEISASTEERLLRALATEEVRRAKGGPPARNRLLSGAKADLSPFRWRPRVSVADLVSELRSGPAFVGNDSGPSMGLVPEVHTFGGTVGRTASTIGASSPLLSLLIRHGLLALRPSGSPGHGPRGAGGPLLDDNYHLSWPIWTFPLEEDSLRVLFCWSAIHAPEPDRALLSAREIDAVYRSAPFPLSDTVSVFRWGRRAA
jgi:hypothetical protein